MKISCNRTELLDALVGVSKAVSTKTSIPAIEGILFRCEENSVTLTAYDLDLGIMTTIGANVYEMGETVLNARLLLDMVKKITCDDIFVECDSDMKAEIKGGITKFNFIGIPAADFPEIPVPDTQNTLTISGANLREMIGKTIYAVSTSDQRPVHTGSKFVMSGDTLRIVSVDGYRLAICKKEGLGLTEEKSFIVPAKTLIETSRLIADSDCEVQIATARRYAVFTFGAYTVVTRLLEGDFLDYKKSIPDGWRTRVKIDVRALFDAVERAALIVNERFKSPVKLFFDNNRAVITCATALGNSYDEIDCELEGDAVEISFNNKYLLDALRYSGCDEIYLEIGGSTAPMKVVPTEGTDFLFLVLPVRTKSDRA